ncbi:MAG TPA: GatB/YqeY domain-containing protein [Candidatus Saccharimonadales bacterium]|nr:GatB/YqeY domain-containing protein [Candidatus Saccharimonadales bacterium]
MQEQIDKDLKQALLSGDKTKAETLRGIKSALLNEAIAQGARDSGLSDDQIQKILARESKKRQEAADLYKQGGSEDRAQAELAEKAIIDAYLPEPMDEAEVAKIVDEEVARVPGATVQNMGQIIGAVRGRTSGQADGALIAKLVKEKLGQ